MLWEKILALFLLLLPTQLGRHFWLNESYVLGLKVDYLSPTLYFQDILVFLLIFIWLKSNQKFVFKRKFIFLSIFYVLFLIFNIGYSLTPLLSFFAWLRISEFILLAVVISKNSALVWKILQRVLPITLIFEFGLGFFQVIKGASAGGFFWFLGERTFNIFTPGIAKGVWLDNVFLRSYGTFSHPNSLAGFILVSLILIFSKKSLGWLDKLSVSLGFFLIILCFSRTVWLAVFFLGLCFVLKKILSGFKIKKLSLDFLYFFSLFVVLVSVFLFLRTSIEISSFENRKILADAAFLIIKNNLLFGVGANNFIISLAQQNNSWQWFYWLQPVHNIFLLAASETGLIGLLFFVAFLCLTIKRLLSCYIVSLLKNKDNNLKVLKLPLLTALFAILFTGLFDHYWLTLIQNQLLFTVVLGLSWSKRVS